MAYEILSCLFHSCDFVHHCPLNRRAFSAMPKKACKKWYFCATLHGILCAYWNLSGFDKPPRASWTAAAGGLVSSVEASKQLVFLRQRLGCLVRRCAGVGRPSVPSDGLTASVSHTRAPGCCYQLRVTSGVCRLSSLLVSSSNSSRIL